MIHTEIDKNFNDLTAIFPAAAAVMIFELTLSPEAWGRLKGELASGEVCAPYLLGDFVGFYGSMRVRMDPYQTGSVKIRPKEMRK
jgi:hypothetical protein